MDEEKSWYLLHLSGIVDGSSCSVWWQDAHESFVKVAEVEVYSTAASLRRCIQLPAFKASGAVRSGDGGYVESHCLAGNSSAKSQRGCD